MVVVVALVVITAMIVIPVLYLTIVNKKLNYQKIRQFPDNFLYIISAFKKP